MSDFGYLKILINKATLFPPLALEEINSSQVQLHLSNSSLIQKCGNGKILQIRRSTEQVKGLSPEWDDYIELRCCLGWELKLFVQVTYQNGKIETLEVDNLIVGTCTTGGYYIRQTTHQRLVCGEITLSIDFFPNHQSLRQLIIDCCPEKPESLSSASPSSGVNGLPGLLLTELQEMIKQQIHSNEEDDNQLDLTSFSSSWIHLLSACQSLTPCAENSLSELSERLYEQHFASSISSQNSPKSSSRSGNSSTIPHAIEEYRVAATARSFLLSLTQDLPKFVAPSPTIYLIEKQLVIYRTSLYSISSPSPSRSMSWSEVLRFVLLISIWFLQHSFIALSLCNEYHITPRELSAIRTSFERYDKDLSGDISAADVRYLLQDMGENYTEGEVALLLTIIDADDLGMVEFPELIRWWCDETGEGEGLREGQEEE